MLFFFFFFFLFLFFIVFVCSPVSDYILLSFLYYSLSNGAFWPHTFNWVHLLSSAHVQTFLFIYLFIHLFIYLFIYFFCTKVKRTQFRKYCWIGFEFSERLKILSKTHSKVPALLRSFGRIENRICYLSCRSYGLFTKNLKKDYLLRQCS